MINEKKKKMFNVPEHVDKGAIIIKHDPLSGLRIPIAPGTKVHPPKKKYTRKVKHKRDWKEKF